MTRPQRRPAAEQISPEQTERFAKMYYGVSSRRDLNDPEKILLYTLLDHQRLYGFAFASWAGYAQALGKNWKNVKRCFQKLEARFPGLFLIRRFERQPNRITVNLDALDRQKHLPFPGEKDGACVTLPDADAGGACAPPPGGASAPHGGGASAPL
ncbi:MAG TPA: hypothetical protein VG269_26630 [Tepidisphaeraceae bacterium]|jgi:hypothetical protein|nr:hypothetical protein [Tepidisphaeraceae bacterium]